MENLEEYIRKHREELDRYTPAPGVWKRIRSELNPGKQLRWISVAAMITVILGTTFLFLRPGSKLSPWPGDVKKIEERTRAVTQLRETEIYYNNLANTLYMEATPMLARNPEVKRELLTGISQLDSICLQIKKDLKDNIANKEVIEALIQNYRLKIRLLEEMLTVMKENEDNDENNQHNEL